MKKAHKTVRRVAADLQFSGSCFHVGGAKKLNAASPGEVLTLGTESIII